jgi:hypothetical protein
VWPARHRAAGPLDDPTLRFSASKVRGVSELDSRSEVSCREGADRKARECCGWRLSSEVAELVTQALGDTDLVLVGEVAVAHGHGGSAVAEGVHQLAGGGAGHREIGGVGAAEVVIGSSRRRRGGGRSARPCAGSGVAGGRG